MNSSKNFFLTFMVFLLAIVLSVSMFAVGTILRQNQANVKTDTSTRSGKATRYVVIAFCHRFTEFEQVDLRAWNDVNRIEHKYPHPNPKDPNDNMYHIERRLVLDRVSKYKKKTLGANCESEINKAMNEAEKNP